MNKLLLIALGIASAAAGYVQNYYPMANNPNNYFDVSFGIYSDIFYSTNYAADGNSEGMGLVFSSFYDVIINLEFFSWYTHSLYFTVVPLYIMPLGVSIDFVRPISGLGTHATAVGESDVIVMDFYVTHVENAKVCSASILDAIMDSNSNELTPTCAYNTVYESIYIDDFLQYNAGVNLGLGAFYGLQEYFSYNFF
jgi:hypothetical protein